MLSIGMYNINSWMIVKSSKRGYNSTSTVKTPMPGISPANIPPKTPNRNNNNSIVLFYNNFNLNASGESHTRLGPLQQCCLSLSVLGGHLICRRHLLVALQCYLVKFVELFTKMNINFCPIVFEPLVFSRHHHAESIVHKSLFTG